MISSSRNESVFSAAAVLAHLEGQVDRRDLTEVQVLAHVRDVVGLGVHPVVGVVVETVAQKGSQHLLGCAGATLEDQHWLHLLLQLQGGEQRVKVAEILAVHRRGELGDLGGGLGQRDEEPVQVLGDLGTDGPRRALGLVRDELDRDHHVALDLDHGAGRVPGDVVAPLPLVPQVAAVADHQRGIAGQTQGDLIGRSPLDHEGHAAAGQLGLDVTQTLEHEVVVPEVGLGIVVHQPERDQHGQVQLVGPVHRVLQRVVELGALGLLHPVEDVVTLEVIAVGAERVQLLHPFALDTGIDVVLSSHALASALRPNLVSPPLAQVSSLWYIKPIPINTD